MMRSRKENLALVAGILGLAVTIPNVLPPMLESLVLGTSVGMVVAGPIGELVNAATKPSERPQTQEVRLKRAVKERRMKVEQEFETALRRFDSLISRDLVDPGSRSEVSQNFKSSVDTLTSHYPVWDPEGRLRTYVLLKKIADSMDHRNVDEYLDLAYATLVARGDEAAQLSHLTLNGKVERIYREPWSESAHRLAGTLLLMNRGEELYAESMVVDALHLWSDARFSRLEADFAAVPILGPEKVDSIIDLLDREAGKARRFKDEAALRRAQRLKATILSAAKVQIH